MATQQQIDRRKKLLNKAVKPTTNPLDVAKNQKRLTTLQGLNTAIPTTVKPGVNPVLGGRPSTASLPGSAPMENKLQADPAAVAAAQGPSNDAISWYAKSKGMDMATYNKLLAKNPALGDKITQQYADFQAQNPEQVATYGEIGEANIQADYDANVAAELGLTGEATGYTSMEEYFKDQYAALKENTALSKEQYDLQKTQLGEQASAARNTLEGNVEAASGLMGDREGVISGSNVSARDRLKEASSVQISRLQRDQDMSMKAIELAKTNLARAEREGNTTLASQYRQQLLAAESAAQATETAYVNALTMASEEERNVQAQKNANLTTFTGMVDQGVDLSVESISNFANQLGVDFDTAYGYYAGAQAIRDDKSLDLETKQTELANLNYDFQNKLAGIESEEAKSISNYMKLVQSGQYSEEELSMFATSMGIPNEKNPVYQAELAVAQAEATIKNKEAQGIPVTQSDWATYYDNIAAQNEVFGTGGEAYIPNNSLEGITSEYAGGRLNIATNTPYQCGEFVNRFWGLSSKGSGGFGSTYQSKKDIVNNRGIIAGSVDINNYTSILKPGMAFVSQAGDTGHVGIITQVLPDGRFMTMEANIGDSNVNTPDVPIPNTRSIKDADIYGYAAPPGDYSIAGQDATGLADSFGTAVSSIGFTSVAQGEIAANEIEKLVSSGQYDKAKDYLLTQVKNSSSATERGVLDGKESTIMALNTLNQKLAEFEEKGGNTGIFTGLKENALQKGGFTSDPELAEIANSIGLAIVDYRRAISGAAFTESEAAAYDQIFPSVGKTGELNQAKINSIQEKLNADMTNYYRSRLGGTIYDEIFSPASSGNEAAAEKEVDPEVDRYDTYDYTNDDEYQEILQMFGSAGIGSLNPTK